MPHDGRVQIMTYMRRNIADHRDPLTVEVNATTLAEDACQKFGRGCSHEWEE